MFIAHLPAGYLLTNWMTKGHPRRKSLMAVGLIASITPDLDLFWFYLVNERKTNHHDFVFHWPVFWIGLALLSWFVFRLLKLRGAGVFIGVALANLMLHMILDSVAAEIYWLSPLADFQVNLVEVPARYDWWVWNFVLHWTFLVELSITLAALITFWRNLRSRRAVITS